MTRRLLAHDQGQHALDLASQVFGKTQEISRPEAVATIGLDLFTAGKKELAEQAAEKSSTAEPVALPAAPEAPVSLQRLTPPVLALATLFERTPKGFDEQDLGVTRVIADAEVAARKGDRELALRDANRLPPEDVRRIRVALAVGSGGKNELEAATKEAIQAQLPPWRLARSR